MKYLCSIMLALILSTSLSASNFLVFNSNDSGPGSLRDAINQANANPGLDIILFNIPGAGPHEIALQSPLPFLSNDIRIAGLSQPGAIQPTATTPAVLKIALNGAAAGAGANGLSLSNNSVVAGIAIYGFDVEINVAGNNNRILACHIGLDATGTIPIGTAFDRMIITGNSNIIGGATPNTRNVIAGSNNGIVIFPNASNNRIMENYIGTDASGNNTIPGNGFDGIAVSSNDNFISSNVVVGYGSNNILIGRWSENDPIPQGNIILGNQIGHHADGSFSSFANNCQGISIDNAMNTTVRYNVIYGNGCNGVLIDGNAATGNLVSRNSIYGNGELSINLGLDWVTPNDPGDGDTGPNQLQNYPVLQWAKRTGPFTRVKGNIDTPDPGSVIIEFYVNAGPNSTGHGDGRLYLGRRFPKNNGKFNVKLPGVPVGAYISAIAIDSDNNTSEFALSIPVTGNNGSNNLAIPSADVVTADSDLEIQVHAFPNPATSQLTITYELPEAQTIQLNLIDGTGKRLQTIVNSKQDAGFYRQEVNVSGLPSGLYFYQLVTEGKVQTGKVVKD